MSNFKILSNKNGEKYSLFKEGNLLCNMIKIPEGSFRREDGCKVKVSSFYLGEFPVTQELYEEVTSQNPSGFKGEDRPIETVTWYDAVEFCDQLSRELPLNPQFYEIDKSRKDKNNKNDSDKVKWIVNFNKNGKGFRLPTEAEWEFAAKGGKGSEPSKGSELFEGSESYKPYSGSKLLEPIGWYEANNGYETKTVGMKFPNKLGLFDMSGNVWEWCYDWYADYDKIDLENPIGPKSGTIRVRRGGGWFNFDSRCRSEDRISWFASDRNSSLGFRLVFVP